MRIYFVKRGWDNPECSPNIVCAFKKEIDAHNFVISDIFKYRNEHCDRYPDGVFFIKRTSPRRWESYNSLKEETPMQDEVWIIEELKVC
jgi:hypothetical protein